MVGIRLNDGNVIRGNDWEIVESLWAADFMNQIIPEQLFRPEIRDRAKVWSGLDIAIDGSSYDFLYECERAGLVTLIMGDAEHAIDGQPGKSIPRTIYLDRVRELADRREHRKKMAQIAIASKGKR